MASARTPNGPLHVGRIVDPLAREDGETEPELHLEADTSDRGEVELDDSAGQACSIVEEIGESTTESMDPSQASGRATANSLLNESTAAGGAPAGNGVHPVRQRLLARAAAARRVRGQPDHDAGLTGFELEASRPPASVDSALDQVAAAGPGAARPPAAPRRQLQRTQLSPNMIAVVGTLLGLVTIASVVALGIHLEPILHPAPTPSSESATAAPRVEAQSQPRVKRRDRKPIPGPWRIRDVEGQSGAKIITGAMGREPFLKAIQDAGIPKKQAYRVLTAMKGLRDLDRCDRSDRFVAWLDSASGQLKAFEYVVSAEQVYQAKENAAGLLVAQRLDLKVKREQVSGAIAMNSDDLTHAASQAGFESGLVSVLRTALEGHLALEEVKRGDTLRVIAQEVTVLGEFARYAGIEALEYRPAAEGKPLRIYYFRSGESGAYYDARGRAPYEGGWRKPIPDAPVTSPFDLKRMHPVLKKVMPHYGVDFGAPAGTPVGASSFGTVSFIGYLGPAGNLVKIEHPGGIETGYAHLQRFAEGLQVGDRVKRLQVVGYVGSTGRSTGPHLHFSAKKDGKFFDPMDLKLDAMRVLPKEERPAFAQVRAKYDQQLDAIELPAVAAAEPVTQAEPPPAAEAPEPESDSEMGVGEGSNGARAAPEPAVPTPAAANPIYLTDQELLEMQPRTDDGEVTE